MSLYTRTYRPSMGCRGTLRIQTGEGLSRIIEDSPLSSHYVSPVRTYNTKLLLHYFRSVQVKQYGKSLELSDYIIIAHIKMAFDKGYTPERICRSIRYASTISQYVFSIPFAIRSLDESNYSDNGFRLNSQPDQRPIAAGSLWD